MRTVSYTHLDPLREEAAAVVNSLKCAGISKVVMMTGDSERTASAIAKRVGVDEYYSEVLPEDKASFIEKEKKAGRKVVMIGDGINDSPALSAADVGIAISDGAELAREIADVTAVSYTHLDVYKRQVGKYKAEVMAERIAEINPQADVRIHKCFFLPENAEEFPFDEMCIRDRLLASQRWVRLREK